VEGEAEVSSALELAKLNTPSKDLVLLFTFSSKGADTLGIIISILFSI
jgi:hypothetical protein